MTSSISDDPRKIQDEDLKALREELLRYPGLVVIGDHPLIVDAITRMRKDNISHDEYEQCVKTVTNLLLYRATEDLPLKRRRVTLKNGNYYRGQVLKNNVILVPVLRAGLPMEEEAGRILPSASVGFINAERDECTGQSKITGCKLPLLKGKKTFILEQVVATGDTVRKAIGVAKSEYEADDITLLCCLAAPQGLFRIISEYPKAKVFLGHMDETLDENYFVYPGIGDAGDRTFGVYHKPKI